MIFEGQECAKVVDDQHDCIFAEASSWVLSFLPSTETAGRYAGDTQFCFSLSTAWWSGNVLNKSMEAIMGWWKASKLNINPDKPEVVLVHTVVNQW